MKTTLITILLLATSCLHAQYRSVITQEAIVVSNVEVMGSFPKPDVIVDINGDGSFDREIGGGICHDYVTVFVRFADGTGMNVVVDAGMLPRVITTGKLYTGCKVIVSRCATYDRPYGIPGDPRSFTGNTTVNVSPQSAIWGKIESLSL